MKKSILLLASVVLSTAVFAGNIQQKDNSGTSMHGDFSSMHDDIKSTHNDMKEYFMNKDILKNEKMQRLHKEMTLFGMSEVGMEARLEMISSEKGRAYHRAL
jgi:hypothetical protein